MIRISQSTFHSYQQANYYLVDSYSEATYALRIGQINMDITNLLARHNATTGLFFTAWNPHSIEQPAMRNKALNQRLLRHPLVARIDVKIYASYGKDDAESWCEHGYFFTNIDCGEAQHLCLEFAQNAGVMVDRAHPAALVWHPAVVLPANI